MQSAWKERAQILANVMLDAALNTEGCLLFVEICDYVMFLRWTLVSDTELNHVTPFERLTVFWMLANWVLETHPPPIRITLETFEEKETRNFANTPLANC